MSAFLLRRLLMGVATVFAVTTLTFVLLHAAPGEPYAFILEDARFAGAQRDAFIKRHGLDRPIPVQYGMYLARVARGDLDDSFRERRPVVTILRERLPRTLLLMGTALGLGFALGIALGAWQAARRGSRADRLVEALTVAVGAIPDFWIAIALLLLFGLRLRWFPVGGMIDETMHDYMSGAGKLRDVVRHLALPSTALLLLVVGVVARFQRAAVLDVLPEDYVRTARAKGLGEGRVIYRHALRNALLPTITLLGLTLPALVGGAVFVEQVFSWPGLGTLAIRAITDRDYPVVLGVTMVASLMVVLAAMLTDVAYALVDPRTRRG